MKILTIAALLIGICVIAFSTPLTEELKYKIEQELSDEIAAGKLKVGWRNLTAEREYPVFIARNETK
jgi:hypothetical protein